MPDVASSSQTYASHQRFSPLLWELGNMEDRRAVDIKFDPSPEAAGGRASTSSHAKRAVISIPTFITSNAACPSRRDSQEGGKTSYQPFSPFQNVSIAWPRLVTAHRTFLTTFEGGVPDPLLARVGPLIFPSSQKDSKTTEGNARGNCELTGTSTKTALFFPIQRCGVLLFFRPTVCSARTGPLPSTVRRSKTMQSRGSLLGVHVVVSLWLHTRYAVQCRWPVNVYSVLVSPHHPHHAVAKTTVRLLTARCQITGLWLSTGLTPWRPSTKFRFACIHAATRAYHGLVRTDSCYT
ncbi:hypothetical protein QBC36DRAFT_341592 [Triangularia setosa]|uniref:Uncharacterized protein n=1 Tax=Triangularia setosa TaxID=2587417 RepID=A0AAN6VVM0_9PEZI|nr:hypothetical protein QBC36DRAFT_341592 [Podospora setosa]